MTYQIFNISKNIWILCVKRYDFQSQFDRVIIMGFYGLLICLLLLLVKSDDKICEKLWISTILEPLVSLCAVYSTSMTHIICYSYWIYIFHPNPAQTTNTIRVHILKPGSWNSERKIRDMFTCLCSAYGTLGPGRGKPLIIVTL